MFVPEWAQGLRFVVRGLELSHEAGRVPDAFAMGLFDATSMMPIGGVADSDQSDSLLTVRHDGSYVAAARVSVDGNVTDSSELDGLSPWTGQVSLDDVTPGTLAIVSFDLVGFGEASSRVVIDHVEFAESRRRSPVAVADSVTTAEDKPVAIPVLANDRGGDFPLDPSSVRIDAHPLHGVIEIDPDSGMIFYTPENDFAGVDSLTYQVADTSGLRSTTALVELEIVPVSDPPVLTADATRGDQDTPLPLSIEASTTDVDGSESLWLTIENVPGGGTLSRGNQIAGGRYRLAPDELEGLTMTPPSGWTGKTELMVHATAKDGAADPATVSVPLPVVVDPVLTHPLSIDAFVVNDGEAQRSLIQTASVRFNQDVEIVDPSADVRIVRDGVELDRAAPERFDYDAATHTLYVDLDGVASGDGEYVLSVRASGVAAAQNRSVTLASGPLFSGETIRLPFHRLLGDLTGDNRIDSDDWALISEHYGSAEGDPRYWRVADLNDDGFVDRGEYFTWINRRGRTADTQGPVVVTAISPPGNGVALVDAYPSASHLIGAIGDLSEIGSVAVTPEGGLPVDVSARLTPNASFQIGLDELFDEAGVDLGDGDYRLTVTASDVFGNEADPFVLPFTIDDTPPPRPSRPMVVDADGESPPDEVIGTNRFVIRVEMTEGHPNEQTIVRLYRDGEEIGLALADDDVDFEVHLGALGDGEYRFTATAEDAVGNRSPASEPFTLVVDTTPPVVSHLGLSTVTDSGIRGDRTTSAPVVTIVGDTEPGATVMLDATGQSMIAGDDGHFAFSGVVLPFGTSRFTVTAADTVGNERTRSLTLLRPKPESDPPVLAVRLANDTGLSPVDQMTNDPAIMGAVDDESEIAALQASINGGGYLDISAGLQTDSFRVNRGQLETAWGKTITDGDLKIAVIAEDVDGNRSEPVSLSFDLDSTPPARPETPRLDRPANSSTETTSMRRPKVTLVTETEGRLDVRVGGVHETSLLVPRGDTEVTLGELTEGTYQIDATLTDRAGNVSDPSPPLEFTVDLTPPEVSDLRIESAVPGSDLAVIRGATEPNASVTVFRGVDGRTVIAASSADETGVFVVSGVPLRDRDNVFGIVATDQAGNEHEVEFESSINAADRSAPTIVAKLDGVSDDEVPHGSLAVIADPTIRGVVDDASRIVQFRLGVNDGPLVDALGSLSGQAFEFDRAALETVVGGTIPDGPTRIRFQATDEWFHVSPVVELNFDLDASPPSAPIPLRLAAESDTGSLGDGVTNADELILSTGADEASEIILYADGEVVARADANSETTFRIAADEGRHRYVAQSVDHAGNSGPFTPPLVVNVDRSTPSATMRLESTYRLVDLADEGLRTGSPSVDLVGTTEPNASVTLVGGVVSTTADAFGKYRLSDVPLDPGDNMVEIRFVDVAGNSTSLTETIRFVDETPPSVSLSLLNDTGRDSDDGLTSDPTVIGRIEDASGVARSSVSINGSPWHEITGLLDGGSFRLNEAVLERSLGQPLSDGRYVLTVRASDPLGHETETGFAFDLDRTSPPVAHAPDLVTSSDSGFDAFDDVTNVREPTVRMYAERGADVTFRLNGAELTRVRSTGSARATIPTLAEGTHHVTAIVEDLAGNRSDSSAPLTIEVDTTVPRIDRISLAPIHHIAADETRTPDAVVTVLGIAEPGTRVTLAPGNWTATASIDGAFTTDVGLDVGRNAFEVVVEDRAGNRTTRDWIVVREPDDVTESEGPWLPVDDLMAVVARQGVSPRSLLANDPDPGRLTGEPWFRAVSQTVVTERGATVTITADGYFEYEGNSIEEYRSLGAGETGWDRFAYHIENATGSGTTESALVTLDVVGANDPPDAFDDAYGTVAADDRLVVGAGEGVLANDSDPDTTDFLLVDTVRSDSISEAGAIVTLRPDGSFDFDPNGGFDELVEGEIATDRFRYVVIDSFGASSDAYVEVRIVGVDDAPIAGDDAIERGFWTVASRSIVVPAERGVLANDRDPDAGDADLLEAVFDGYSELGARVIVDADGGFSYDPTASATLQQFSAEGVDVVDRFEYLLRNVTGSLAGTPGSAATGSLSQPSPPPAEDATGVVEIVLRSGPSTYSFDLVADGFESIGRGPSINNHGEVAFRGTTDGVDSLYVWREGLGTRTLISPDLADGFLPRRGPVDMVPMSRIDGTVQINDDGQVIAQRQMNAKGLMGVLPMGTPVLNEVDLLLSYAELWDAGATLNGEGHRLPRQIAVGDSGLAAAGLRWGDPFLMDLQISALSGVMKGVVGVTATSQFTLVPRVWLTDPIWAGIYFSPVNPVWNVFQEPGSIDTDVLNSVALATSLAPIYLPQIYVTPFDAVMPGLSVNNAGQVLFSSQTNNAEVNAGLQLVTYGHDGKPYKNAPVSRPIPAPRLADSGDGVFVDDGALMSVTFDGDIRDLGFRSISETAAISDSGVIAATADGPAGRGIYAIDPASGNWLKVVGESGDGSLDPNEVDVDGEDVGGVHRLLDGPIGINGPSTTDAPGTSYFTVTFMAADSEGNGGLHSARFLPAAIDGSVLDTANFLGHHKVVDLGEILPGVGIIEEIAAADMINHSGQIVFWAGGADGEKLVRATPPIQARGEVIYAFENRPIEENETQRRDGGAAIASFVAGDPLATPEQFVVTIDFGDGHHGEGTVRAKIAPDGATVPLTFEVVADHTYRREGPYAATVHVTDNKNENGGVAVSLVNVVDVVSEEEIARLSLQDAEGRSTTPEIQSFSFPQLAATEPGGRQDDASGGSESPGPPRSFGLTTLVHVDRSAGTYEVASMGTAGFSYRFALETGDGAGLGEPSVSQQANGSSIKVRQVIARGQLDPVTFSPASFNVASYETAFDGEFEVSSNTRSTSPAENSTTEVNVTSEFVDRKRFDGETFDWTLASQKRSEFKQSGERLLDPNLQDRLDGMIAGAGGSLVGSFVIIGDETTTDALREFGPIDRAHSRERLTETSSRIDHRGGRNEFSFLQISETDTTFRSEGTVSDDAYALSMTTEVHSVLVEHHESHGPRDVSRSGSTNTTVIAEKSGSTSGAAPFHLLSTTTRDSVNSQITIDQGRVEASESSTLAVSSSTAVGSADTGAYRFDEQGTTESHVQTAVSQGPVSTESTVLLESESTTSRSGNLYQGNYQESAFRVDATRSDETTANRSQTSSIVRDGVTRVESESVGNRVSGQFHSESTATTDLVTTTRVTNQTSSTERRDESEIVEISERSGNAKSGSFEFAGSRFQTNDVRDAAENGPVVETNLETVEIVSTWEGNGDARTGRVEKEQITETSTQRSGTSTNRTRVTTTEQDEIATTRTTSIMNRLSGDFTHDVWGKTLGETMVIDSNRDRHSIRETTSKSTSYTTSNGNSVSSESTHETERVDEIEAAWTDTIHTETVQGREQTRTVSVSSRSANQTTGEYDEQTTATSERDVQRITRNQTLESSQSIRSQVESMSNVDGNRVAGIRSEVAEAESTTTTLMTRFNGENRDALENDLVAFHDVVPGGVLIVSAGTEIPVDDRLVFRSVERRSTTTSETSDMVSGSYQSDVGSEATIESVSVRNDAATEVRTTSEIEEASSTVATGNRVTGESERSVSETKIGESRSDSIHGPLSESVESESIEQSTRLEQGNRHSGMFDVSTRQSVTDRSETGVSNGTLRRVEVATSETESSATEQVDRVSGEREMTEARTTQRFVESSMTNRSVATETSQELRTAATVTISENSNTGEYTETRFAESDRESASMTTNGPETRSSVDATVTTTSSESSGNRVTGAFIGAESMSAVTESESDRTNQTLREVDETETQLVTQSERAGNAVTGDYHDVWTTDATTQSQRRIENQSLSNLVTIDTDSAASGAVMGNHLDGAFERTQTGQQTATRSESVNSGPLNGTSTFVTTTDSLTETSGNVIHGDQESVGNTTEEVVETGTTSVGPEQTTVHVVDRNEVTSTRDENVVSGEYHEVTRITIDSGRLTEVTNRDRMSENRTESAASIETVRIGNRIDGDFQRIESTESQTTSTESEVNGPRSESIEAEQNESTDVMVSGNAITGTREGIRRVVTAGTIRHQIYNQGKGIDAEIEESIVRDESFVGNAVEGTSDSTTSTAGTRTRHESVRQQTLAGEAVETTSFASEARRLENTVSGGFDESVERTQNARIEGNDFNKSLTVEYVVTVADEQSQSATGNVVAGGYQAESESTSREHRVETESIGPLTVNSELWSEVTTSEKTTGDSIAGTSDTQTVSDETSERTQFDENQTLQVSVTENVTDEAVSRRIRDAYEGTVELTRHDVRVLTRHEESSNQGELTEISERREEETVVESRENLVTGASEGNESISYSVARISTSTLGTESVWREERTSGVETSQSSGDLIEGDYEVTTESEAETIEASRLENKTLRVIGSSTTQTHRDETQSGNRHTGAFERVSVATTELSEESWEENQTRIVDSEAEAATTTVETETGNEISGVVEMTREDETEQLTDTTERTTPFSSNRLTESVRTEVESTEDRMLGDFDRAVTRSADTVFEETYDFLGLIAARQSTTRSESDVTTIGNLYAGTSEATGTENSVTRREATEENRGLSTKVIAALTENVSFTRQQNDMTGAYGEAETRESVLTATESGTNRSILLDVSTDQITRSEQTRVGNVVTGDFNEQIETTIEESNTEVTQNQTLRSKVRVERSESSTSHREGNARLGESQFESDGSYLIVTDQHDENGQRMVESTRRTEGERTGEGHDDEITGTYSATESVAEVTSEIESVDHGTVSETFDRNFSVTTITNRVGNSVDGDYSVQASVDESRLASGVHVNQTLRVESSEESASVTEMSESGNDRSGDYVRDESTARSVESSRAADNRGVTEASLRSISTQSNRRRIGNQIAGDYNEESTSTGTESSASSEAIADRTTDRTDSGSFTRVRSESGNEVTTAWTAVEAVEGHRTINDSSVTGAGPDDSIGVRTDSSSTEESGNRATGVYERATSSITTIDTTEAGRRVGEYDVTSRIVVESDTHESGNAVVGDYRSESVQVHESESHRDRKMLGVDRLTLTDRSSVSSDSSEEGNAISGAYERVSRSTIDVEVGQTLHRGDGFHDQSVNEQTSETEEFEETGDQIAGTFRRTSESSRVTSLTQSGTVSGFSFDYASTVDSSLRTVTTGNRVTGIASHETSAVDEYFYDSDREHGDHFVTRTAGSGRRVRSISVTDDTLIGEVERTTTGTDSYRLAQSGSDATGVFAVDLTGEESYAESESTLGTSGTFVRVTEVSGSVAGERSLDDVVDSVVHAVDQVVTQTGSYLDGTVEIDFVGAGRDDALVDPFRGSNTATGTAGWLDHSPTGAPTFLGRPPAGPSGVAAQAAGFGAGSSLSASPTITLSVDPHRSVGVTQVPAVVSGTVVSGSATVAPYASWGSTMVEQYCFPAGTEVLLADGRTKPIERIFVGERVAAVGRVRRRARQVRRRARRVRRRVGRVQPRRLGAGGGQQTRKSRGRRGGVVRRAGEPLVSKPGDRVAHDRDCGRIGDHDRRSPVPRVRPGMGDRGRTRGRGPDGHVGRSDDGDPACGEPRS